jgi:1-acyl-sn-glycerol-3-phosphate acyltransferase
MKVIWYFGFAALELMLHRPRSKREGAEWLHRFCARVIAGFGVKVTVEGQMPERGALITDHTGSRHHYAGGAAPCGFLFEG